MMVFMTESFLQSEKLLFTFEECVLVYLPQNELVTCYQRIIHKVLRISYLQSWS